MNKQRTEELRKYNQYLKREAVKFKLTPNDLSNLHDLFYIVDNPSEMQIDFRRTLKINGMHEWFRKFHERIQNIVIPELKGRKVKKEGSINTWKSKQ